MEQLRFSVFPTRNSASGAKVFIPDLRIIRGFPGNVAGHGAGDAAIAARLRILEEFGRDMVSPYREILFLDFNDERTDTFYAVRAQLPGILQNILYCPTRLTINIIHTGDPTAHLSFMESLIPIEILQQEDMGKTYYCIHI
jgi:hypothetical protein